MVSDLYKIDNIFTTKELEDSYGVGTIDLQKGEFIPAPKQEEAPAETEEVPAE